MDRFHENLSKWLVKYPNEKDDIKYIEALRNFETQKKPFVIDFCETPSGKPNLKRETKAGIIYLYSQEDPLKESEEWFSSLSLDDIDVIVVYGIGLGYYYEAAVKWLKEDKKRSLVFLEDDSQVMYRFLESEICSKILDDNQVMIVLLGGAASQETFQLSRLSNIFTLTNFIYTALRCYEANKPIAYLEYKSSVSFMTNLNKASFSETSSFGIPFFRNFFSNFLDVSHSYLGNGLFGKFKGVPAIICGAGPSLNKNIDVLATLNDRALLFAGGTALNALNAKGVMPHFGVGIDPNPDQFTRLIANHAYETPFLYRCRMLKDALDVVHGDHLYISGSGGYKVAGYLEKKLGLDEPEIEEGFNVLNFSVLLAHAMGCNPIICVGIDLAYSEGDSYAAGVINHPIHDLKGNFRTKRQEEELVPKTDIYGKPIFTLWKWIAESMWYTNFLDTHPKTTLINATEGGIGFPRVVNKTLKEVKEEYLKKQVDLATYLHGEIQNSHLPKAFNEKTITEIVTKLIDSLSRCSQIYQNLIEFLSKEKEEGDERQFADEISAEESKFLKEEAYSAILKKFEEDHRRVHEMAYHRLLANKEKMSKKEFSSEKAKLDRERYQFLKETAFFNSEIVQGELRDRKEAEEKRKADEKKREIQLQSLREKYPLPTHAKDDEYFFDQNRFLIKDSQLDIHYKSDILKDKLSKESLFYPSGKVKQESFYLDGTLHGPSFFYSDTGVLLASSWFIQGKQEGKMRTYYANGAFHSLQLFKNGLKEGMQQYFYPNGTPKSLLPYKSDLLHGEVLLFGSSGCLVRQLSFVEGRRTGIERIWTKEGVLKIECQYDNDRPVGRSRVWHPNGQLAKDILYCQDSKKIEEKNWDEEGKLIEEAESQDYFDQMNNQTDKLTASLNDMVTKMAALAPIYSEKVQKSTTPLLIPQELPSIHSDLAEELAKLQNQMKHLQGLGEEIKLHLVGNEDNPKEAIWKSPSSRQQLENQFKAIKGEMGQEMDKIQQGIKDVISSLLKDTQEDGK